MTIDEAIEELKSENGYYANNGMTDVAEFNTKIIRLLEELKELREYFNSTEIGKYRFQKGYNKAIDDFVNQFNVIVDEKCGTDANNYFRKIVKEVAEQLKESEAE